MVNLTAKYYEEYAKEYFQETVTIDVSHLYTDFLNSVPKGGHLLDAGCGSGRDSLFFLKKGYKVSAFDASPQLAKFASNLTGINVESATFQSITLSEKFDGIWACASLLHVPDEDLKTAFMKLKNALKPGGILYCSFKVAKESWTDERGRLFTAMTETQLRHQLTQCNFSKTMTSTTLSELKNKTKQKWDDYRSNS